MYSVYKNGKVVATEFKTYEEASYHCIRMHIVSVRLGRHEDRWQVREEQDG